MKNETPNDKMCDKIYDLTAKIVERVEEVKSLACNEVFDNQKIIGICQQINVMLCQIEALEEFISPEDKGQDPLKITPFLN